MSPHNDGYVGPRDGPFRGRRLQYCLKHGEPVPWRLKCPACAADAKVVQLEAEATRRCRDCRLRIPREEGH